MRKYWQVASGSSGREYADEFKLLGVACVGGLKQVATMGLVNVGDRILLKKGTSEVLAVGEVTETNSASPEGEWLFDFDGWHLNAWVRVDWHCATEAVLGADRRLAWDAICQIREGDVTRQIDELICCGEPLPVQPWSLEATEQKCRPVNDEELLEDLVGLGTRPSAADDLIQAFRRIRLLAAYYNKICDEGRCLREDIREHEIRTFLVAPLLLALGWAEQQIKIELGVGKGKRIDMACFGGPYVSQGANGPSSDCLLIVETKKFSEGLSPQVFEQAKSYANEFPLCKVLAVTNGYVYKTFVREEGEGFSNKPEGYLNILKPRRGSLVYPEAGGALDVLSRLLPS